MSPLMVITLTVSVSVINANNFYDFSNESYEEVKNSRNFTGKVVLVTGSSSGIGEGIVKLFSILGANVVITGRNETKIKTVAEEVQKLSPNGLKPLQVVADLTNGEDLKELVEETIKEFGKIDVLVNNAGLFAMSSVKDEKILDEFDTMFNIDVRSILHLIHHAIPYLEKSKGTIINISSIASLSPKTGYITHQMAKAALDMMTKVLAIELGPLIRVNAINPGSINSHPTNEEPDAYTKNFINSTPLKRLGEPLDIAKGVAFLASTDAQFLTGVNLVIDGGVVYNFPAGALA